eukprot:CAMPEP_0114557116 /NCGR_PEP_ID=MMETSP0114-20121206/9651_1 /TAXON_ID=31324 /ORGANISM="Goniomonas sp, Strain m" /LENGTH=174 /DNA_ID=CAMNT_0001742367 /DNA_START=12 /DNA_END=536 /DNA_ORIENTATION=+
MNGAMNGCGVGIMCKPGTLEIFKIVPGGSASKEPQVQVGDFLVCVNGVQLRGKTIKEVAELLVGQEGTLIDLQLRRGEKIFSVRLQRSPVVASSVAEALGTGTTVSEPGNLINCRSGQIVTMPESTDPKPMPFEEEGFAGFMANIKRFALNTKNQTAACCSARGGAPPAGGGAS